MKPKHLLFAMLALFASINVLAYDVEIDGINYNFIPATDNEVEVTGRAEGQEPYSGSVVIPESVTWDNMTYSVTRIGWDAFRGCNVTSITIPNSVTSIGDRAFGYCTSLTSISVDENNPIYDSRDNCNAIIETATNTLISGSKNTVIPNSVTRIGYEAFLGVGITSINIPGNVKSIENCAFAYSGVTSVTISDGVLSIGHDSFLDCYSLTSITIPKSMTNIPNIDDTGDGGVFGRHPSLASISVDPENLIYDSRNDCNAIIEKETNTLLYGCKNTIIPNTVTRIAKDAFFGCSGLESITIPESVTSIGGAFPECSNLKTVKIGSGVTSIDGAFGCCFNLKDIYCYAEQVPSGDPCGVYPGTMLRVPAASLEAYRTTEPWSNFDYIVPIVTTDDNTIITFTDPVVKAICVANWDTNGDGELSKAEASVVTDLGTVFKGNAEITSFDELQYFIGLARIGKEAFAFCENLSSFTIPNYVACIDEGAFTYCQSLTSVTIPSNVKRIDTGAFSYCGDCLTSITISEGVQNIGYGAFECCTGLTSITIPSSVTSFGGPGPYESFGKNPFTGCFRLTSIIVETGNTTYDSRENCNAIIETETNTLIAGCQNTIIPNDVVCIEGSAFNSIGSLNSITIPESVTNIGNLAFWYCSNLTSVNIPSNVTSIGWAAFMYCFNLTSITIPEGVTSIDRETFMFSGLSSVTISQTVTGIGNEAFAGCKDLRNVYCYAEQVPNTSDNAFNEVDITVATLHVPAASLQAYSETAPWSNFGTIVAIEEDQNIAFADTNVKAICVGAITNWDTNGDGELSESEAAAVTDLGEVFRNKNEITTFNELQYFTGLTNISNYAFYNCSNLTSIIIPNNVTSIGNFSFHGCNNLSSITIHDGITSLGNNVFEECFSLPSITIPNSVSSIGGNAFTSTHMTSIVVEEGNTTYDSRDNCNAIIESETNKIISGCKNTTIPSTVTSIGREAFSGRDITTITIPNSITSVDYAAFFCCTSLTDVWCYAENIPITGDRLFTNTPIGEATLHVPAASLQAYSTTAPWSGFGTIVAIDNTPIIAFADANVKAICVGATTNWDTNGDGELSEAEAAAVTDLGTVFKENNEITSFNELQYFTGLTSISNNAFQGCSSLTFITIPSSISRIGTYAFSDCVSLTSVTLPNSVTSIGGYAFYNCMNLKSVMMPASIITFEGYLAFGENNNIESVYITDLTKWLGIDFRNNNPLRSGAKLYLNNVEVKDLVIPDGTTSILEAAFEGCESLTSVTIPSSVTSISNWSFASNNNLATVTIAEGVTSIGDCVFKACSSLTDVWCYAENIPITGDRLFTDTPIASATLHVPAASLQVYSTTAPWSGFGTKVAIEGAGEEMLYAEDATVNRGATFELPIHMDNGDEEITAFSFDVEVPAGVTILSATLSERKADQTNPVPTLKSDGSYGLATLSVSNANFSGSEGTLLTLIVKVNANVTPGNYTIKLKNIELSTISNPIELPDCTSTLTVLDVMTGDVNGDGKVSIFDAVQIINYILENDPDPFIFSAADLDGNGKITIFDAVSVVNIILTQSSSNNVKEMQFIDELDPQ